MTKITTKFDGKDVTITLTKEQIDDIKSQTSGYKHYTDIKTVLDAIDHLTNIGKTELLDELKKTASGQIKLVARAINSLIDNKKFPDFKDTDQYKYYPYFKWDGKKWVVCDFGYFDWDSYVGSGFTKDSKSALYLGNQFIDLYVKAMEEY